MDDPPVVVTPGVPCRNRGIATEDLIESRPHVLGLFGIQLHVAERENHSVTGHCSMLRVRGKVVDLRVALGLSRPTFRCGLTMLERPRENLIAFV